MQARSGNLCALRAFELCCWPMVRADWLARLFHTSVDRGTVDPITEVAVDPAAELAGGEVAEGKP